MKAQTSPDAPGAGSAQQTIADLQRRNAQLITQAIHDGTRIAHLRRHRDELQLANNRLLARARRAEAIRAAFVFAPVASAMMVGYLLCLIVGGAR